MSRGRPVQQLPFLEKAGEYLKTKSKYHLNHRETKSELRKNLPDAQVKQDSESTNTDSSHPFSIPAKDLNRTGSLPATNQVSASNVNTHSFYLAPSQSYQNKGCWPGYHPSQLAVWWVWEMGCCSNPRREN